MPDPDLLVHLRDHLVSRGIVRVPRVAGAAPPMWLDPRRGVPAPGEGDNSTEVGADVVLGAYRSTGITSQPLEGFRDRPMVELRFRSRTAPLAYQLHYAIRAELHDRRNWSMGGIQVNQSLLFIDLQRIGSDEQGFEHRSEYEIELWA